MDRRQRLRVQAREQARESVGRVTRWAVGTGMVTTAAFGLAFGFGDMTSTGTLQPPPQAPTAGHPVHGYASAGGS